MFKVPSGSDHPREVFNRLLVECEEFRYLLDGEPVVEWLFKEIPTVRNNREILGTVYLPSVQGQLKPLFEWFMFKEWGYIPDYLVVLDDGYWESASSKEREILVYHETCHMIIKTDQYGAPMFDKDTGTPKWALAGHDVEEFVKVVKRYGAHNADIAALIRASLGD